MFLKNLKCQLYIRFLKNIKMLIKLKCKKYSLSIFTEK